MGGGGVPEELHQSRVVQSDLSSPQTDIEITREEDFTRILQMEEEYIQQLCEDIIRLKPDVVITEKGISGGARSLSSPPWRWARGLCFLACRHRDTAQRGAGGCALRT